ncbi:MAG: DUF421 domain-containing protein [Ruminococcus sp.]|nr:DUF421 domain-containing protein [Ruminococcus sp.]
MENKKNSQIDKFRLMCTDIAGFNIDPDVPFSESPNRLIGFDHFIDVFKGLVPLADYDGDGNFAYLDDFPEIFPAPFPNIQKTGSAVLFTGEAGCGKHTADNTFMSVVYRFVENELIEQMADDGVLIAPDPSDLDSAMEYYRIENRFSRLSGERQLGRELDGLFEELCGKAFAQPEKLFYFSLGDVTAVMDSKLLAPRFAEAVRLLIENSKARCVLTCVYQGKASCLENHVKKPFYVLELTPPTYEQRRLYFSYIIKRYNNIKFALNSTAFAGITDGFTFGMIKQLTGYLFMKAKSEVKRKKLKMNYIRLEAAAEQDKIRIDEQTIRTFADMVKNTVYEEKSEVSFAVPQTIAALPSEPAKAVQAETSLPKKDKENNGDGEEDFKDMAENAVKGITTTKQLYDQMDMLIVPTDYKQKVLMEHQTFSAEICDSIALTAEEFLSCCRDKGLRSLTNLKAVTISLGGHLLVCPWDSSKLSSGPVGDETDYKVVISEGVVNNAKLKELGRDEAWLQTQLKRNGCSGIDEVFLGVCDDGNGLIVYRKG